MRAPKRSLAALIAALAAAAVMGGCGLITGDIDRIPWDETGPWTRSNATEREEILMRGDFSMEIVRFTDSRRPRSMMMESKKPLIYSYDPDNLLGGVSHNVPNMLSKYLAYRPKMAKHYKVEMDVKKLITNIETGTLMSGSWGRYHVEFDVAVIVRRPDSTVAWQRTLSFEEFQPRKDTDGRGPSKEFDRARMYDLADYAFRKAAEQIGWAVYQGDARRWKVPAPETIPTRLNMPSINRASGTPAGPIVVPSAPAYDPYEGYPPPADEDVGVPEFEVPVEGDMGPIM